MRVGKSPSSLPPFYDGHGSEVNRLTRFVCELGITTSNLYIAVSK